jgi:hypothetical protein
MPRDRFEVLKNDLDDGYSIYDHELDQWSDEYEHESDAIREANKLNRLNIMVLTVLDPWTFEIGEG